MADIDRVLVVGAGIGGLVTTIALRSRGIDARLFDRARTLGELEVGGGLQVWPNAFRALRQIGLDQPVAALGRPTEGFRFMTSRGRVLREASFTGIPERLNAPIVSLRRADLQRTLVDALEEGVLRLDAECTRFEQDDEGVDLHFSDGRTERGAIAVGADGADSLFRRRLTGREDDLRPAGRTIWVGSVTWREPGLRPELITVSLGRYARIFVYGVEGEEVCWYVDANVAPGTPESGEGPKAAALRFANGFHAPLEGLIEATPEDAIHRRDLRDIDPFEGWSHGRVTLLGDAAHAMLPDGSQGACQAIEDAIVLMKCLDESAEPAGALREYEGKRSKRTSDLQSQARRTGRIFMLDNPFAMAVRNGIIQLVAPMISKGTQRAGAHDV